MAFIVLGQSTQLQIKVPTIGSTDWADTLRTQTFLKIAEHQHTGAGDGSQLGTGSILADAITGAKIRLDNDEYLKARNAADSANINILKVDTNDDLYIDPDVSKLNIKSGTYITGRNQADSADINILRLDGGDDLEFSPDVSKLNLKNNTYLTARNNADSADINVVSVNTSDKIALGADLANLAVINDTYITGRNNADSAYIDLLKVNTSDKIATGADFANLALIGNTYLQGRNQADSGYIDIIKVTTSDLLQLGAELVDAQTNLIKAGATAITLNDNQAAAVTTGITGLSTDESNVIKYRLVRNGVTQNGELRFNDADSVPSEVFHGTDVGVTFSVTSGILYYTSTSTGNNISMTYVQIKE
jgi:hypothetical protein